MNVYVTSHALHQSGERFPNEIIAYASEVNAAMKEGRVSKSKPLGLHGPDYPDCLYCWTPCRRRCLVVKVDRENESQWVVVTVMRPTPEQLAAAS